MPRASPADSAQYAGMKQQGLTQLICETREVNKSLQFEVEDLKQKLVDTQGDIKVGLC